MDLDYGGDLVHGAVQLGRAVEQMTDDAPQHDGTTMPLQIDSKRRKKLRQKNGNALMNSKRQKNESVFWKIEVLKLIF